MADVLDLYNDIAKAADDAIKKTASLARQVTDLQNIKPIASTLFHGTLGVGLTIADPMEKFVKGEATFRRAAADFVTDAKQIELGGKIVGRGIEEAGGKFFAQSQRITSASQAIGKVARDWTSTATMMDDSIKALAGRTGMLATSFRGLAQVIKFSTGPIASALLATSAAYSHFVKQWMDDSDRLEKRIQSTANLFRDGSIGGMRAVLARGSAGGYSRQETLDQAQVVGTYGSRINASEVGSIIAIARVMVREAGQAQNEQLRKLAEHVSVQRMKGVSDDEIQAQLTRQRILAGGSLASVQYRSPFDRYQSWKEDVGYNLNLGARGMGPQDVANRWLFTRPGDIFNRARGGLAAGMNWVGDNVQYLAPFSAPGQIQGLGSSIGGLSQLWARGGVYRDYLQGMSDLERAGAGADEQSRRYGIRGVSNLFASSQKAFEYSLPGQANEVAQLQERVNRQSEIMEAAKLFQKGSGGYNATIGKMLEARNLVEQGAQSGSAEEFKKNNEAAEKLLSEIGESRQELLRAASVYDKYAHEFPSAGQFEEYTKKIEDDKKRLEHAQKYMIETQKSILMFGSKTGLETPGEALSTLSSATPVQIEQSLVARELERSTKTARRRQLEAKSVLELSESTELTQLKARLSQMHSEETGLSSEDAITHRKLMKQAESATDPDKRQQLIDKAQALVKTSPIQTQEALFQEHQMATIAKQRQASMEIAGITLPTMIESYQKRGMIGADKASELHKMGAGGVGSVEAAGIQIELQKAAAKHQATLAAIDNQFVERQRAMQANQMSVQAYSLQYGGSMSELRRGRVTDMLRDPSEVNIRHAQNLIQEATQQREFITARVGLESQIAERAGARTSIGLGIGRLRSMGAAGPETRLMNKLNTGGPLQFDQTSGIMQQILSTREKMYQQELQFTIQYAQARMNIIQTHYQNANAMERGGLEARDRRYAPQIRYGQEMSGAYQAMAGAQMGRYAGEDYRRQQGRSMMAAYGMQIPEGLQRMWAIGDFQRNTARQKESDVADIRGAEGTWGGVIGGVKAAGGTMADFMQSEGGRGLKMQLLQQNQAAYSRQGIDVSGQIMGLARQQQQFAGQKMFTELQMRKNDMASSEEQIDVMEREIGNLKPGRQQDVARAALGGAYRQAAQQALAAGDLTKAQAYMKGEEQSVKGLPAELKAQYGDAQKQSLAELKTQTGLLSSIDKLLGGKGLAAEDTGTTSEPEITGGGGGKKTGPMGFVDKFGQYIDKFGEILNTPIQINLNGQKAATAGGATAGY